jgi:hypothetical protein
MLPQLYVNSHKTFYLQFNFTMDIILQGYIFLLSITIVISNNIISLG